MCAALAAAAVLLGGGHAYAGALTDFDLGGIVSTADQRYLIAAQGTTGQLWRIDLHTRAIVEVDLAGARLTNADGIVLRANTLWVVQNFTRLKLHHHYAHATIEQVLPTPADRSFTTAKRVDNRLLVVDSKFGFPPTAAIGETGS